MEEKKCIECGRPLRPGQHRKSLCAACTTQRVWDNARQLKAKKGPYYEKWKAGVKAHAKDL